MNCHDLMKMIINEYNNQTDFSKTFDSMCASGDKFKCIELLINKYNTDFDSARMVIDYFIDKIPLPSTLSPQQQARNQAVAREALNKPKCPTCSSTNLSKISTISKAGSVAMFGLLSQKVKKQFHCNNCGYEW